MTSARLQMFNDLNKAKETYPVQIDLSNIEITYLSNVSPEDVIHYGEDFLVYAIDTTWHGELDGLLIEWYTDEDFSSGVFEEYTLANKQALLDLNKIMKALNSGSWDFELANKHIEYIDRRYSMLLPTVIKLTSAYDFNSIVEDWLAGEYEPETFRDILARIDEEYDKYERQEVAGLANDVAEELDVDLNTANMVLNGFDGVTFIY